MPDAEERHRRRQAGDRLKSIRKRAGIGQRELERALGLSPGTLAHIEHGDDPASDWIREAYEALERRTELSDLPQRPRQPKALARPPFDQSGGRGVILAETVSITVGADGMAEYFLRSLTVRAERAGLHGVRLFRVPADDADSWEVNVLEGGSGRRGRQVGGYYEVVAHMPFEMEVGEEHTVTAIVVPPKGVREYITYRHPDNDVRSAQMRLWIPSQAADRFIVKALDDPPGEPARLLPATTNGMVTRSVRKPLLGHGYGLKWEVRA